MTATFRVEIQVDCDSENCKSYPHGHITVDNADVEGKTTFPKLKRALKKYGWIKIGETWLCPKCAIVESRE